MGGNGGILMSDAAWAWEGLRRNPAYRKAWARHAGELPVVSDARASVRYLKLERPYLEAETYGVLAFADPDHSAAEVPVFWRPDLLSRTLRVSLSVGPERTDGGFSLASLKCCPTVLDTVDGERHVRLGGLDFWIQMVTEDLVGLDDDTRIDVILEGRSGFSQRITSAEQLFSLHASTDGQPQPAKRPPNRTKLHEGLLAWDIYYSRSGRRKRSLRDVAAALVGEARVEAEWSTNRSLKDLAVRARDRGRAFVGGGYCDLLRRASF